MERPYHVISVESRKGGVGKTTAALNLAKLLLERGFQVLFLDIDITGTNVTNVLDSPFWLNSAKTSQYKMGNNIKPANLLEIFSRHYMSGQTIPSFDTNLPKGKTNHSPIAIELDRINVIGSQVFDDENEKELICEPSFLFDKLHAYWFVEFLKGLCSQFVDFTKSTLKEVKRNQELDKCVIILDNSPGYVGFAPMIQEWLTDYGPDKAKLLMVSSHDKQDLMSCSNTLKHIHNSYSNKLRVASIFYKTIDSKKGTLKLCDDDRGFVTRLFETSSIAGMQNELHFYHQEEVKRLSGNKKETVRPGLIKGATYKKAPEKYLAILLNKVLEELFSSDWKFSFSEVKKNIDEDSPMTQLLFNDKRSWQYSRDLRHVVRFDEFIDFQYSFDSYELEIQERYHPEEKPYISNIEQLKEIKRKIDKDLFAINFNSPILEKDVALFFEWIEKAKSNYLSLLSILDATNDPVLTRLLSPEFRFETLVTYVESLFTNSYHFRRPIREKPDIPDELRRKVARRLIDRTRRDYFYEEDHSETSEVFLQSSIAVALLSTESIWGRRDEILEQELPGLLAFFANVESRHWKRRGKKRWRSQAEFLVNAEINIEKEEHESRHGLRMMHVFDFDSERNGQVLFDAYRKAQARLITLPEDYMLLAETLIRALYRIQNVEHSGVTFIRDLPFMSNLRNILRKAIIDKSISYDQATTAISEQAANEAQMLDFQKTLKNVLTDWEVDSWQ